MSCPFVDQLKQPCEGERSQADLNMKKMYDDPSDYSLVPKRELYGGTPACLHRLIERSDYDKQMMKMYDDNTSYKVGFERKFAPQCSGSQCEAMRNQRTEYDIQMNKKFCCDNSDTRAR